MPLLIGDTSDREFIYNCEWLYLLSVNLMIIIIWKMKIEMISFR